MPRCFTEHKKKTKQKQLSRQQKKCEIGAKFEKISDITPFVLNDAKPILKDPIYSKNDIHNFESYIHAFIADAKRHGINLDYINPKNYKFEIKKLTDRTAEAFHICNSKIGVRFDIDAWDHYTKNNTLSPSLL